MGTFQRYNDLYTVQTTVYNMFPNPNPRPKPTHHRKLSAFLHFQKNIILEG